MKGDKIPVHSYRYFSVLEAEAKERDFEECLKLIKKGQGNEDLEVQKRRALQWKGQEAECDQVCSQVCMHSTIHHLYTTRQPEDINNSLSNT